MWVGLKMPKFPCDFVKTHRTEKAEERIPSHFVLKNGEEEEEKEKYYSSNLLQTVQ